MNEMDWYYSIEVEPGVTTPGNQFSSIAPVRKLLSYIDSLEGLTLLDIGTMEGLIPILAERRGARAMGWDRSSNRANSTEKLDFLWDRLKAPRDVRYTDNLREFTDGFSGWFDVVVLAGVLYHTMDPFSTLLRARNMLSHGGLMVIETAICHDPFGMHFNGQCQFYPDPVDANYWFPSITTLVQMIECARMEVIAVERVDDTKDTSRLGLLCRAKPAIQSKSAWVTGQMGDGNVQANYEEFVRFKSIPYTNPPKVNVDRPVDYWTEMDQKEVENLIPLRLFDTV